MWKQQVLLLGEVVERLPDTIKQKESRASHHFFPLKVAGLKSSHEQEASFDHIDAEWVQAGFHSQHGHHRFGSVEDLYNLFCPLNKPIFTLLPHCKPRGHWHWQPFFHLLRAGMPTQIKWMQAQLQRLHH